MEEIIEEESNVSKEICIKKKIDTKLKIKKPGIIYLNYIPRYLTVKKVREIFSTFGEVRRLFLKPEKSFPGKPSKFFEEGWVEFTKKRVAKEVAVCLNGTQIGGKRRTPYYDALWSIKYLPKFQWSDLGEKKAYEKAHKTQQMKAEVSQVKRQINFYSRENEKKKRRKKNTEHPEEEKRDLISHITFNKKDSKEVLNTQSSDDKNLLIRKNIFGTSTK